MAKILRARLNNVDSFADSCMERRKIGLTLCTDGCMDVDGRRRSKEYDGRRCGDAALSLPRAPDQDDGGRRAEFAR